MTKTVFESTIIIIESHLAEIPNAPQIEWPMQSIDVDSEYLRVTHLFGDSVPSSLGSDGYDTINGITQVDCFVRSNANSRSIWPDRIARHFSRQSIIRNETEVRFVSVSMGTNQKLDNDYYFTPVSINWQVVENFK